MVIIMAKALYIHIPFCNTICTYCDFPKLAGASNQIDDYIQTLCHEMDYYRAEIATTETIYIGGGTPSSIGLKPLAILLSKIESMVRITNITEYTIEANPQDITTDFVKLIKSHHVSRVSVGVQTINPQLQTSIGRHETKAIVIQAVKVLKEAEILNINLDFIYGIPGETLSDLQADIDFAVSVNPQHLSFYSLILEEKTKIMHDIKSGKITPIDKDIEADMFELVMNELPKHQYFQYEISNFSKTHFQSKHNMIYWKVQPYLGLGMGAHSQVEMTRFHNYPRLAAYLKAVKTTGTGLESCDPCNLAQETGLMNLRLLEGISVKAFHDRFGYDILTRYPLLNINIASGLLELSDGKLRLTHRGIMLMNRVETSFIDGSDIDA
jgi:oxygen-independent coproporphyrinogen-3 oxidase